jgi:integrase/recombinase XerD
MKTVREAVGNYLALRRSLGFKLKKHQRLLEEFASFLEQESTSQITSRLALLWATQPQHIQPAEWAARLSVVRGFARYWSATDATTDVPPDGLLPYRPRRAKPYLYSDEQIDQLLETAKNMPATHTLQPWTYHCLLGLLAVAGLRISEALNLQCGDIDWSEGVLTIRCLRQPRASLARFSPSLCRPNVTALASQWRRYPTPLTCPIHLSRSRPC